MSLTSKPLIRRTYGSKPSRTPSSTSFSTFPDEGSDLISFGSLPGSSSPPSSSVLNTPPGSPPRRVKTSRNSSPSPWPREDEDEPALQKVTKLALSSGLKQQSTLKEFFAPLPGKKRPLQPATTISAPTATTAKSLTQLHLTHLPLLSTCPECHMSYIRGGDDEGVHGKHHARVTRGIIWDGIGKGKGKAMGQGWRCVQDDIRFGSGNKSIGRIVVFDGSWGGSKMNDILCTVDTVLSSPPLPTPILDACKVFLLLTAAPPPCGKRRKVEKVSTKERIIGVVVAQPIKWAMRIIRSGEEAAGTSRIDSGGGVMCDPERLPTPLGIHRLFLIPSFRSLGLATIILEAATRHTVYGYRFDPLTGEVAFSQPTESGRKVLERWSAGQGRVFVDDESQL
ncbi:N-acetyltransferase, partial [Tremellales sp. Uapishka_1]